MLLWPSLLRLLHSSLKSSAPTFMPQHEFWSTRKRCIEYAVHVFNAWRWHFAFTTVKIWMPLGLDPPLGNLLRIASKPFLSLVYNQFVYGSDCILISHLSASSKPWQHPQPSTTPGKQTPLFWPQIHRTQILVQFSPLFVALLLSRRVGGSQMRKESMQPLKRCVLPFSGLSTSFTTIWLELVSYLKLTTSPWNGFSHPTSVVLIHNSWNAAYEFNVVYRPGKTNQNARPLKEIHHTGCSEPLNGNSGSSWGPTTRPRAVQNVPADAECHPSPTTGYSRNYL